MAMLHLAVLLCVWLLASTGADASSTQRTAAINTLLAQSATGSTSTSGHSNNWAVIVCSSRYWLNYRHGVDAMAVYHEVKRLGIPDTNIIVMMADDYACNARNTFPGRMYANESYLLDVYGGGDVEVDYRCGVKHPWLACGFAPLPSMQRGTR